MKNDSPAASEDLSRFKALLEEHHRFPGVYLHKFVGKNTDAFRRSVEEWEKGFIGLRRKTARESANGGHVAYTYEYQAVNAEDVVQLAKATKDLIEDLLFIL